MKKKIFVVKETTGTKQNFEFILFLIALATNGKVFERFYVHNNGQSVIF